MKNILPPPTLPVLPSDGVVRSHSAITATLENTMLDTATEEWLTNMGVDFGLKRPPIFFHDDDLWRAVIKVLAFEHRHTREAVRSVFELILKPMKSQATVLDRIFYRGIATGDLLVITSGPNAAGSPYTVTGVTAHELIFAAGTFGTIPDAGPITYNVGTGPAPIVGPTSGINGTIYLAADGTHRFSDPSVKFLNTHKTDFLTKTNQMFPQYGTVIFDKNSLSLKKIRWRSMTVYRAGC